MCRVTSRTISTPLSAGQSGAGASHACVSKDVHAKHYNHNIAHFILSVNIPRGVLRKL